MWVLLLMTSAIWQRLMHVPVRVRRYQRDAGRSWPAYARPSSLTRSFYR
jgi:hypothetical protein